MTLSKPAEEFAIAAAVLIAFCAPLYLLLIGIAVTDGFKSPSAMTEWATSFLGAQDSALTQFHKLLLPLITGISAWRHKDSSAGLSTLLVVFCVTNVLLAIIADVYFRSEGVQNAIGGNYPQYLPAAATLYFTRVQETLMMYLMLLIGLKAAKK